MSKSFNEEQEVDRLRAARRAPAPVVVPKAVAPVPPSSFRSAWCSLDNLVCFLVILIGFGAVCYILKPNPADVSPSPLPQLARGPDLGANAALKQQVAALRLAVAQAERNVTTLRQGIDHERTTQHALLGHLRLVQRLPPAPVVPMPVAEEAPISVSRHPGRRAEGANLPTPMKDHPGPLFQAAQF